jgi:hypothetical protein
MKTGTRHQYYLNDQGDLVFVDMQDIMIPIKTIHESSLQIPKNKTKKTKKNNNSGNGESNERDSGISD